MKKKINEVFPVASFILEEIEARGWSKEKFIGKKGMIRMMEEAK